jgi:hypothetical protein
MFYEELISSDPNVNRIRRIRSNGNTGATGKK